MASYVAVVVSLARCIAVSSAIESRLFLSCLREYAVSGDLKTSLSPNFHCSLCTSLLSGERIQIHRLV